MEYGDYRICGCGVGLNFRKLAEGTTITGIKSIVLVKSSHKGGAEENEKTE